MFDNGQYLGSEVQHIEETIFPSHKLKTTLNSLRGEMSRRPESSSVLLGKH